MNRILKMVAGCMVAALMLTACRSQRALTKDTDVADVTFVQQDFLQMVNNRMLATPCVTAKMDFSASLGGQEVTVDGNLKMKRDDVIRIQLVAYGIMEVGILEFTQEDVLMINRLQKQYVRVDYNDIDFFKSNGINFFSLQALFWNELFVPGEKYPETDRFLAVPDGSGVKIRLDAGRMDYEWLADRNTGRIDSMKACHRRGNSMDAEMAWHYKAFKTLAKQVFPTDIGMQLKTGGKVLSMGLKLKSLGTDEDWKMRTSVSKKYQKVEAEDIFRKLTSL